MRLYIPDRSARVLVAGDLMLDRYLLGVTDRISPEAPVPVVRIEDTVNRAGGSGNVATNVAALQVSVDLLAPVGKDEESEILKQKLTEDGISCYMLGYSGYSTAIKSRVLSQNQQLIRLDRESPPPCLGEDFFSQYLALLESSAVVVLSDYGKGALQDVPRMIAAARKKQKTVLIDPKGDDYSKYRGASLITPNSREFEKVVGQCTTDADRHERGFQLCKALDLAALLITRGSEGMDLLRPRDHNPVMYFPAQAHEVYDVTGAGDTVIAAIAASLASGNDLAEAVRFANYAASIVVGKTGTSSVTTRELNQLLRTLHQPRRGVFTLPALQRLVALAKHRGETVVFTNGCFDILHAGHVALLREAKAMGDYLIVALNDDASVKRLKGSSRPVNTLSDRFTLLSDIESVDWLVSFEEDTPEALIRTLCPDVLVKGGDYREDQVVGADSVLSDGGVVKIIPLAKNHSTTRILKRGNQSI